MTCYGACVVSSTIGGDDPAHDLSPEEKKALIKDLLARAKALRGKKGAARERQAILNQINELARSKSKKAHQR